MMAAPNGLRDSMVLCRNINGRNSLCFSTFNSTAALSNPSLSNEIRDTHSLLNPCRNC